MHSSQSIQPARAEDDSHRGFTIVELIASIAIVGLLMAMILPAVQTARESARRVTCINHLKQYGTAITGFETTHREFPAGFGPFRASNNTGSTQSPIAQAIDWLGYPAYREFLDPQVYSFHFQYAPQLWPAWSRVPIPVLLCPSDQGLPGTNYVACTGSQPHANATGELGGLRGMFSSIHGIKAAEATDGLSMTVAASERIQSDLSADAYSREQDIWGTGLNMDWITDADQMVQVCGSLTSDPPSYYPHTGWSWDNSEYGGGSYNHLAVPNSPVPDCVTISAICPPLSGGWDLMTRFWIVGMSTARSRHPGGVNVLFLDGGVRFVSNSIDLRVWRGIGTIAAAEVVGDAF